MDSWMQNNSTKAWPVCTVEGKSFSVSTAQASNQGSGNGSLHKMTTFCLILPKKGQKWDMKLHKVCIVLTKYIKLDRRWGG